VTLLTLSSLNGDSDLRHDVVHGNGTKQAELVMMGKNAVKVVVICEMGDCPPERVGTGQSCNLHVPVNVSQAGVTEQLLSSNFEQAWCLNIVYVSL
jgi:hypothetical protein